MDWGALAKEGDYKTGRSAYMGFSRIRKKMGWPSDGASRETVATSAKRGANIEPAHEGPATKRPKRRATKKEMVEYGDEIKGEAVDDEGPVMKRPKRNPVKKEEVVEEG